MVRNINWQKSNENIYHTVRYTVGDQLNYNLLFFQNKDMILRKTWLIPQKKKKIYPNVPKLGRGSGGVKRIWQTKK